MFKSIISLSLSLAFIDRSDLKVFLGPPPLEARIHILLSCVVELGRVGIVNLLDGGEMNDGGSINGTCLDVNCEDNFSIDIMSLEEEFQTFKKNQQQEEEEEEENQNINSITTKSELISSFVTTFSSGCDEMDLLIKIGLESEGMSGRSLRKLPMQSFSQFISTSSTSSHSSSISLTRFLEALYDGTKSEKENRSKLGCFLK